MAARGWHFAPIPKPRCAGYGQAAMARCLSLAKATVARGTGAHGGRSPRVTPTQAATFDPEPAAAPGQERTLVVAAPRAPRVAVFCTDERMLIEQAAQLLSAGLRAGGKVVALMDPGRLQQLLSLLAAEGHALEPLQRAGQ